VITELETKEKAVENLPNLSPRRLSATAGI
jgi:hypothetical protein